MDDRNERWTITPDAFDLLLTALHPEREHAGNRYEEIRRTLIRFFRAQGSAIPEEHADEVFNRVTRRLSEGTELQLADHNGYFLQVARFIMSEYFRECRRVFLPIDEMTPGAVPSFDPLAESEKLRERIEKEVGLDALAHCKAALDDAARELLDNYDTGTGREKIERRNALADRFGKSKSTLIVEVCRIRKKLKDCAVGKLMEMGILMPA